MEITTGTEVSSSTTVKCNPYPENYSKVDMMLRLYNEHELRSRRNGSWISSLMNRMQCCHCADCNFLSHKHNLKYVTESRETPPTSGITTTQTPAPELEISKVKDDHGQTLCTSDLMATPTVTPVLKMLEKTEDDDKHSLCNEDTATAAVALELNTSGTAGDDNQSSCSRDGIATTTITSKVNALDR